MLITKKKPFIVVRNKAPKILKYLRLDKKLNSIKIKERRKEKSFYYLIREKIIKFYDEFNS